MILEKNKEIQYMNARLTFVRWVSDSHQMQDLGSLLMRSIVLKILVIKFLDRGCSKIISPTLVVGEIVLGTAFVFRSLA